MSKKYEELFGILEQKNWAALEVDQCASCGRKNGMQEVFNYTVKVGVFSYTAPVAKVCSGCEEVEFDGQETILMRMADKSVCTQRRHTHRDSQAIQSRWSKRMLERSLRHITIDAEPTLSKI